MFYMFEINKINTLKNNIEYNYIIKRMYLAFLK